MSNVTVLTPSGRRQVVKVTPNTTLLQVLEEVCKKHGFKPEDYDIKHHNKVLDVSSIFRFSGLPNNAQLEMAEAIKRRSEFPVVLGLHLESGDRLTGEFTPSDCLWNVIKTLRPEEAESSSHPVVIYMRKEVIGKENLEATTLRSLGLTGGRAMLRFVNRKPEELKHQANVSSLLSRSSPMQQIENKISTSPSRHTDINEKVIKEGLIKIEEPRPEPNFHVNKEKDENLSTRLEDMSHCSDSDSITKSEKLKDEFMNIVTDPLRTDKIENAIAPSVNNTLEIKTLASSEPPSDISNDDVIMEEANMMNSQSGHELNEVNPSDGQNLIKLNKEDYKVVLLGDRNAVAFNLNDVNPTSFEDVADDFYELTVSDAKLLLKDARQFLSELEEAPLMTSAQKELEQNKKMLNLLNQHKKTVIRIKFPDRTVLQGTFSPVDTVQAVEKFVSDYLENPNLSFYLYLTPPKVVLKSKSHLIEADCVPNAVLYFGLTPGSPAPNQYLRSDILDKFSSFRAATKAACQSRGMSPHQDSLNERSYERMENFDSKSSINTEVAGPSSSSSARDQRSLDHKAPPLKIPKWFKPN